VIREDRVLGELTQRDQDGVIWRVGGFPSVVPLLMVDCSAPLTRSHAWVYQIPWLSLLATLARSTTVLNNNTVVPRKKTMLSNIYRRP
jgi:hypothetical protein